MSYYQEYKANLVQLGRVVYQEYKANLVQLGRVVYQEYKANLVRKNLVLIELSSYSENPGRLKILIQTIKNLMMASRHHLWLL